MRTTRGAAAVLAAAVLAACGDMTVNWPSTPSGSAWEQRDASIRTLEIAGRLTTEQGACVEATLLYDGAELPGARTSCPRASGCAELELTAVAFTASGHHTLSFQVLRQSQQAADYVGRGTVRVSRESILIGTGVQLSLAPTRATLRPGESVTFDLDFQD